MVKFKPFQAIRPQFDNMKEVATLPYDVIDDQQARELAKNPQSFVHIDRAEVDLPKDLNPYDPAVYEQAANTLRQWLAEGTLVQDSYARFYAYQLELNGQKQTGLVGVASAEDYETDLIRKHELTRREKEQDRINHIDQTNANSSPILLTYRDQNDIQQQIDQYCQTNEPDAEFSSFFDVTHRIWQLPESLNGLEDLFESEVPFFYIADGHHRAASTVKVAQKRRKQFPSAGADAEFNYFLAIAFPASELKIWDYNRVLNAEIPADFFTNLRQVYQVEEVAGAQKPQVAGEITMYLDGSWYRLDPLDETISQDPVDNLDVAKLQDKILAPLFEVQDVTKDPRINFIGGIEGVEKLQQLVDTGQATIAFALYPTSMSQLMAVADQHELMPPKSTWFEPKLLSGLFIHSLD